MIRILANYGTGKASELVLKGQEQLIDLNEVYNKLIKRDKVFRLEIYHENE